MKQSSFWRRAASVLTTAGVAAAMLTVGSGAAHADPYNCSDQYVYWSPSTPDPYYRAICRGGTGRIQAFATCSDVRVMPPRRVRIAGNLARVGEYSRILCPPTHDAVIDGIYRVVEH
ncbi:hypothetical protein NLX83_36360 [Allokutzneria sp. A3M-2-11 16]|uniref:hypothetical protein n=1 Tax=Allokutzneria sp. A3M-2-11 16 TaxID=2962043 RepID=UPI0020B6D194|nr:hypothetical protein [Allokutzneria sp. A3M-2-11 16]MCP3804754.1 hypothetical protein [Allokutzneria sp. A3M-2-11 16]